MHFILFVLGAALQTTTVVLPSVPPVPPIAEQQNDGGTHPQLLSLREVFSLHSYPVEALINKEQGIAKARVSVDAAGRLTDCRIEQSSGSAIIDRETCAALRARARFAPGLDAKGHRINSTLLVWAEWVLPKASILPFKDSGMRIVLAYDAKGKAQSCRVEKLFDSVIEGDACALVADQQEQMVKNELAGKPPISREMVFEEGQLIGGPDGAIAIGTRSGETLLRKQSIALTIDPDGKLSDCRPVSLDPLPVFIEALWCRRFLASAESNPLPPSQVDRSARHSVYYMAVYLRSAAQ
ncbi:MAG: energy transducer TonB [Sphingomonas bacterium]|nr:energy transducer TonB [Sphingomonas bacterium]